MPRQYHSNNERLYQESQSENGRLKFEIDRLQGELAKSNAIIRDLKEELRLIREEIFNNELTPEELRELLLEKK